MRKILKTPFWDQFGSFFTNYGKNEFSWKKNAPSVFIYSNYLPSCKKSEKNNELFLRKMPNRLTDRWTDRPIDNGDFIGPSVEWCKTV